jgi:hypothetical protein
MKKSLQILIGGALVSMFLLSNVFAQDDGTRISFKRGATSATVKGTVAKGGPDFYLVGAKAGQTMTVKVTGKVTFGIYSDGETLTEDDGNTNWSDELPADGDYQIKVFSSGGAQNYTLTVSIAAETTSQKFTTSGFYQGIGLSSEESGDYYGINVYLTESDGQLFALVLTAEGGFSTPKLVEAKVSGKDMRTVEFTLPNENNGDRKLKGTVSAKNLTLDDYYGKKFVLKRGCGNLSGNISTGNGDDYGGMEVYVTDAGGQWFALVTVAEGVLKRPVLVEAEVTGNDFDRIQFTLPDENGGRKFKGKMTKNGMTLTERGTNLVLKDKCYR